MFDCVVGAVALAFRLWSIDLSNCSFVALLFSERYFGLFVMFTVI
jgi:hypothetical protein